MKSLTVIRVCCKHEELLLRTHRHFWTSRSTHEKSVKTPVQAPAVQQSDVVLTPAAAQPQSQLKIETDQVPEMDVKVYETEEMTTTSPLTYDIRKVDPTTVKQVYFFDTLGLVKTLQNNGFTRQQAEGVSQSLVDVINTTLDHQARHMITKSQQEITVQQLMSEIASVKKDMVILQRSEFSSLRNETEKQTFEIRQINNSLRDEMTKLKGQMTLDINLERSRAVEAHAENQKNLVKLNQKIETEVAHLRTKYEMYRNDVFKYAGGTVLTCAGLCLGMLRLWS